MTVERWKIVEQGVVHRTDVFALRREVCRHPASGVEHPFFVLEVCDWVNVVPVTADGRVVLLKQWRQGLKEITIEIPGGMAEPGERPEQAAARELMEETGYGFGRLVPLGWVSTNPAIQNNRCWLFAAADAKPVAEASPDPTEEIDVFTVPLAQALAMVDDGSIHHTMVVNTFLRLARALGPEPEMILERLRDAI